MKITTTLEVSKQEMDIISDALKVYVEYLNKTLSDSPECHCKAQISDTLTMTNKLVYELLQCI